MLALCMMASPARAGTTFTVNTVEGTLSVNGESLRAAIINANASPFTDTRLELAPGVTVLAPFTISGAGPGASCSPQDSNIFGCHGLNWASGQTIFIDFHTSAPLPPFSDASIFVSPNGVTDLGPFPLTGPSPTQMKCGGMFPTFIGGNGVDIFHGGPGNQVIFGGGGNDQIFAGNAGTNRICGGDGNDRMFGDAGKDTCSGNAEADVAKICEKGKP